MSWGFGYQADGQMTSVAAESRSYNFNYDFNGLLLNRSNPWRTQQITQRDIRGRALIVNDYVGPTAALTESMRYRPDSKLSIYTANRAGNGAWNEARGFSYNTRGQLTSEGVGLSTGTVATDTHSYDANGLGVHTGSTLSGGSTNLWQATGSLDAFGRIATESMTLGGATVHASGVAIGSASVGVTLNGSSQSGVVFDPRNRDGHWKLDLTLAPTNNTLVATATLPISGSTTASTSTFTVLGSDSITDSYDAIANLSSRSLSGSRTQTLTWDVFGRLVNVKQVDSGNNGYTFLCIYDGLGRRIRTIQSNLTNNVVVAGTTVTLDSFFDPQVEFLELGVAVNGARTWKVYGPDLNGGYGSMQGIGGLESTIRESDGQTTAFITDRFGNTLATVGLWNQINWTAMRFGGYGPLEGYQVPFLSPSVPLAEAVLWQGRRIDPTGYYWSGARYLDPISGRFISADPMGHAASWGLYDFCGGDPINGFDPDGRFGKGAVYGIGDVLNSVTSFATGDSPGPSYQKMLNGSTGSEWGYAFGWALGTAAEQATIAVVAQAAFTVVGGALELGAGVAALGEEAGLTAGAGATAAEMEVAGDATLQAAARVETAEFVATTGPQVVATAGVDASFQSAYVSIEGSQIGRGFGGGIAIPSRIASAPLQEQSAMESLANPAQPATLANQTAPGAAVDLKAVLQAQVDRAVSELAANPSLAKDLMSEGSYRHLVERTELADASYGKAIERLVARNIRADETLSSLFSYQSKPFMSTPDFFGFEGYNLRIFDITTETGVESHLLRPYGPFTEFATHPGLPSNIIFHP